MPSYGVHFAKCEEIHWNPKGTHCKWSRIQRNQWNPKGYSLQNLRNSIENLRGAPLQMVWNHEILRDTPLQNVYKYHAILCKLSRISRNPMKSWRVPLATCTKHRWNPKGGPVQIMWNRMTFLEILRGTPRKMQWKTVKSWGDPLQILSKLNTSRWSHKGTSCKMWGILSSPKGCPLQMV